MTEILSSFENTSCRVLRLSNVDNWWNTERTANCTLSEEGSFKIFKLDSIDVMTSEEGEFTVGYI